MSATVSSYIPTSGGTDARTKDVLSFPILARPQAMTFYVRFIEQGTIVLTGSRRVFEVGTAGVDPRLLCFAATATGTYKFQHNNGGTQVVASAAAAPSVGDVVELVGQLGATGAVTLIQSINGAAGVSSAETSALTLGTAWSSTAINLNATSTPADHGFTAFLNIVFVRGIHSLARMRRYAGVSQ